jgi:tRNA-specific adenosine deaminase 3
MKDLYLVTEVEPCFMCGMALVHSRINRVYFVQDSAKLEGLSGFGQGALSSGGVQLCSLKNLNHQYLAFRVTRPDTESGGAAL